MRCVTLFVTSFLLLTGLSGCMGGTDSDPVEAREPGKDSDPGTQTDGQIERPDHEVGSFWTYSVEGESPQGDGGSGIPADRDGRFTIVVDSFEAGVPVFATDSCDRTLHPRGPLFDRRSLGAQTGLGLLNWPLEEGKTWTRGSLNVTVDEIAPDALARLSVRFDGELRYKLIYNASAGWYDEVTDKDRTYHYRLVETGVDPSRDVCRFEEDALLDLEFRNGLEVVDMEAPEGDTLNLDLDVSLDTDIPGLMLVRIEYRKPGDDDHSVLYERTTECLGSCGSSLRRGFEWASTSGTWEWRVSAWSLEEGSLEVTQLSFRFAPAVS